MAPFHLILQAFHRHREDRLSVQLIEIYYLHETLIYNDQLRTLGGIQILKQATIIMASLVFLFTIVASDSFSADSSDSAAASEALATSESQSVGQTMAADARGSSGTASPENSGLELVTNRRKVLSDISTLADLSNEDVVSPEQETVLVIQSENSESASASSQGAAEAAKKCVPQIGLTYADSTACPIETAKAPKDRPMWCSWFLMTLDMVALDVSADLSTLQI
jgi:hypothetical protein